VGTAGSAFGSTIAPTVTELGRLLALHEDQANLLDPANLAEIGSVLASQFRSAVKQATAPKRPDSSPSKGSLTSSPGVETDAAPDAQPTS
jgi:hypothetical protein